MNRRSIIWNHPESKQNSPSINHNFRRPPVKSTASRRNLKLRTIKSNQVLPDSFVWHPESLTEVRDQGQCGSCWAFAITSVMADRIFIQSNGMINVPLSAQHLINCSSYPDQGPCEGNDVGYALSNIPKDGLISEKVRPYLMIEGGDQTHDCNIETSETEYEVQIPSQSTYCLTTNNIQDNIENMKAHIYHEGPIIGVMLTVYPDLSNYSGTDIYEPAPGQDSEGGHAIEIIGWGKNNEGISYWICRNSWGPQWPSNHLEGMGKGWFYVKMGSNTCRMEEFAYATVPKMVNQLNTSSNGQTDAYYNSPGISEDPSYNPSYTVTVSHGNNLRKLINITILIGLIVLSYKGIMHLSKRKND